MSEGEKKTYPKPSLTADILVVTPGVQPHARRVLFIRRKSDPFAGAWALPGGFVEPTETVAEAARRELEEETALKDVAVEELGCFSKPGRDPRGWVVTIAFIARVPASRVGDVTAGDDAASAGGLDLTFAADGSTFSLAHEGAPVAKLAFDHDEIVAAAVRRLATRGAG